MHHDEKGRIAPAQSSAAKRMRPAMPAELAHLRGKTMGGMAKEQEAVHNYPRRQDPNPGRYNYGGTTRKKHHEKLKVIARGKRNDYRKAQTKGLTETTKRFKAKGIPFKAGG